MRPPKDGPPSALAPGTVTHQPSPSVPTGPGEVTFANPAVLRVPASTSVAVWGLPDWVICTVHSRLGLADGRPGHSIRRLLDDVGELADDREA